MNPFATMLGWPMATVSSLAIFSVFASIRSANFSIHFARSAPVNFFHGPSKAALAAATAASTSSGPAAWTSSVTTVSSVGLVTISVSPDFDLTN